MDFEQLDPNVVASELVSVQPMYKEIGDAFASLCKKGFSIEVKIPIEVEQQDQPIW